MATKKQLQERAEARAELLEILDPWGSGDPREVFTVLRHVSASGMSRDISLLVAEDDTLRDITYLAAQALGERVRESNGRRAIRVSGCGMDMGFHLVYNLSWALYSTGDLAADNANRVGYMLRQYWA